MGTKQDLDGVGTIASDATTRLTHLRALEAESIHILREVASEFERPVMLYSIGKDLWFANIRFADNGLIFIAI
jgi:hypothetical protein